MRRRITTIIALVAAVVVVAGALVLIRSAGSEHGAQPAPATSAPGPSGTGSPGPSGPAATSERASPTVAPPPASTAVPVVPAALRGKDIELIPTSQPVVALTFDAGANADGLPSILATLAARAVPATFFLTGQWAGTFPDRSRAIAAAGHRIGNHTATHPHPLTLTDAGLRDQIARGEAQIRAAGAGDPRPLFRFPFGERNAHTIAVVNGAGYVAVRWTVDSLGWQGLNGRTPEAATRFVSDRVLAAARAGAIVLMHVGSHPDDHTTLDAAALPAVVDGLRARGFRFVTLDALLS